MKTEQGEIDYVDLQSEQDRIIGKLVKKLDDKEIKMLGRCLELEVLLAGEYNK